MAQSKMRAVRLALIRAIERETRFKQSAPGDRLARGSNERTQNHSRTGNGRYGKRELVYIRNGIPRYWIPQTSETMLSSRVSTGSIPDSRVSLTDAVLRLRAAKISRRISLEKIGG